MKRPPAGNEHQPQQPLTLQVTARPSGEGGQDEQGSWGYEQQQQHDASVTDDDGPTAAAKRKPVYWMLHF